MSTLRYLSIYFPLVHYRLWGVPSRVLLVVFIIAALTNFPLLLMVYYSPVVSDENMKIISSYWDNPLTRFRTDAPNLY
jgi:hypothetical protein